MTHTSLRAADYDGGGGPVTAHAQLTNMALALRTLADCQDAGMHSPRMGLFYGPSGYGKSVASTFAAIRTNAVYVEARSVWSQRSLLEAIAVELGITRIARTGPRMIEQIINEFNRAPRPLVIDEMDYLVKKQLVEIIRDIHEATPIAIMMIGEEALPAKLKEWERFDNRILVATPAQPATREDALKLRDLFCRQVRVADDLALHFAKACHGVTRRIVTNLIGAEREALADGRADVDRAWWGNRPVRTGEVPTRRQYSVEDML